MSDCHARSLHHRCYLAEFGGRGHSQGQGWSTTEGKRKIIQSISSCPLFSCNLSSVTGKRSLVNMTVSHIDHELNSAFIF